MRKYLTGLLTVTYWRLQPNWTLVYGLSETGLGDGGGGGGVVGGGRRHVVGFALVIKPN